MTARDLIKGALRLLGVLASGENPTAAEAQDALTSLNSLIDTWRTERLMVYAVVPERFDLETGEKVYTMGPGGDFDTARPMRVELVQLIYQQDGDPYSLNLPVEIIDLDQYNRFVVPDTESPIPMWVYIDGSYPLRRLSFYTAPSTVNQVEIFVWKQMETVPSLETEIALPPGYERALRYNLAVELAPEFGVMPSEVVLANAADARAKVRSANNTEVPLLLVDPSLLANKAGFNYLTGE